MTALPPHVDAWLSEHQVDNVQPVQPGMSGGVVYRCESRRGQALALKRWPDGTTASRVAEVHRVESVARSGGCAFVPQLHRTESGRQSATSLKAAGALWELADWMPGSPLAPDATPERVAKGASAIAQFHHAVGELRQTLAPPPAVNNRLRRLSELDELLPKVFAAATDASYSTPLRETIAEVCSLLFVAWSTIRERIIAELTPRLKERLPIQYVLRDVHRDHLFFDHGSVSGLIDFDAMRVDTPLTDLARWGGSFTADRVKPETIWEAVVAGYLQNYPFQHRMDIDNSRALIRELHFSSTWISLANWAVWIRLERRNLPAGDPAVKNRIDQLCRLARQEM